MKLLKKVLLERLLQFLLFLSGTFMSFVALMNADATVNFLEGALTEWNGYTVAALLMVMCGCGGAALVASRLVGMQQFVALALLLIAPLAVKFMMRFSVDSTQLTEQSLGALALLVVGVSSLPLIALSAATVLCQEWLRRISLNEGERRDGDIFYLISFTAGGAILGMAFYIFLVQPQVDYVVMSEHAWNIYMSFLIIAFLLIGLALRERFSTGTVDSLASEISPAVHKGGSAGSGLEDHSSLAEGGDNSLSPACPTALGGNRIFALSFVPAFLMIVLQPCLLRALPDTPHVYVLPLATVAVALAIAFSRPPLVVDKFFIATVPWISAIGAGSFAFNYYIKRYDFACAVGALASLLVISCACYAQVAVHRLGTGIVSGFCFALAGGAFIGAALAEIANMLGTSLLFPIILAGIFVGFTLIKFRGKR